MVQRSDGENSRGPEGRDIETPAQGDVNDQALVVRVGSPLIYRDNNLGLFLANLGKVLEFINREEGLPEAPPSTTNLSSERGHVIETFEAAPKDHPHIVPANTNRLNEEAINVTTRWEERESSNMYKGNLRSDLAILKAIPTLRWDEGELHKIGSTSDLAVLQAIPLDFESEGDGEDHWTENSFEEEPQDELNEYIEKMERGRKPVKQTKYMEALLSPKASLASGRKLRERNPFICYSEGKRWKFR